MQKNIARLRIAFVLDDGLDKPDGVQQYVLSLGDWLIKEGHYVRYLVGETKRTDIKEAVPLSRNLKVRFNANSLSTPLPASRRKIKELLDKEKLDVIHVQVPYSPFMGAKVVKYAPKRTKIVGTFHVLPTGSFQSLATKLLGISLKFNLRYFDQFVSVSKPAQVFAKKTFGIESIVIPNPVVLDKFKVKPPKDLSDAVNIVFLGRLVPRKGCMQLLNAVNELLTRPNLPPVKVNIYGDGNQRQKLQSYINSSNLKSVAKLNGFVAEKDKARVLSEADFAVFPALYGESFGIVLLEAMAAGAGVVLAGSNPGYASVMSGVSDCLFDPTNETKLADKLEILIKNKTQAAQIHNKQQQLVQKFDIDLVAGQLLEIYQPISQNT